MLSALPSPLNPGLGSDIDILVRLGPGQSITVDSGILATYLPGAAAAAIQHGGRGTYDLAPFIARSGAVRARLISPRAQRRATAQLLDSLARNVGRSEAPALDVAAQLEGALARDAARAALAPALGHAAAAQSAFPAAFARFAALAALAGAFGARRVAAVLVRFFVKAGAGIAAAERPRALLRWAAVLLSSELREADVVACLREIVVGRPAFVAEVARFAAATGDRDGVVAVVLENLREIVDRMDGQPLVLRAGMERGRSLLRRGAVSRRYSLPPLVSSGDVRLAKVPYARSRIYSRAPVRNYGYLARVNPKVLANRQDNQEHRLDMLEHKIDAVHDLVETGGYVSDGFVGGAGHFTDDLDMWNDAMMSDIEFDTDYLLV